MNFDKLAEDLCLDKEEYTDLIELFIDTSLSDLDKLMAAIKDGDSGSAERAAHSIKGAAASLGLTEISNEAGKIENAAKSGALWIQMDSINEFATMLGKKINEIGDDFNTYKNSAL